MYCMYFTFIDIILFLNVQMLIAFSFTARSLVRIFLSNDTSIFTSVVIRQTISDIPIKK